MARTPFPEFVRAVAGIVDDMDHKIKEDSEIRRIYAGRQPYRQRVDMAVSYWRGRPGYVDVNADYIERLNPDKK